MSNKWLMRWVVYVIISLIIGLFRSESGKDLAWRIVCVPLFVLAVQAFLAAKGWQLGGRRWPE